MRPERFVLAGVLLGGCGGGTTTAVMLVAVLVWLAGREIFFARQKCPHCGKTGVTPEPVERGSSQSWICDHCGRSF